MVGHETIPSYLDGYCDCGGRTVEYSGKAGGRLLTCYDYRRLNL